MLCCAVLCCALPRPPVRESARSGRHWLHWLQNYGVWVLANLAADEENRLLIVTALNGESLG